MARRPDRFTTGETCARAGAYVFDGYLDGSDTPEPIASERDVSLEAGAPFPAVDGGKRAAWWRPRDVAAGMLVLRVVVRGPSSYPTRDRVSEAGVRPSTRRMQRAM